MQAQIEIEIPSEQPAQFYAKHSCKVRTAPMVLLQRSLDPKIYVGTCPDCGARVYARKGGKNA